MKIDWPLHPVCKTCKSSRVVPPLEDEDEDWWCEDCTDFVAVKESRRKRLLFVGEKRSKRAVKIGARIADGRLAGKQLFDALKALGIDPKRCQYTNWWERGTRRAVRAHKGTVVAMGKKVHRALDKVGIPHVAIVHPAARGPIRLKARYTAHVRQALRKAA